MQLQSIATDLSPILWGAGILVVFAVAVMCVLEFSRNREADEHEE